MRQDSTRSTARLGDPDISALDALFEGGEAGGDRAGAVRALLGLLGTPLAGECDEDRDLLVDVTFARVLRARDAAAVGRLSPAPPGPSLSDEDGAALDEMVGSGWRSGGGARGNQAAALLGLLDAGAGESDRERVVQGTLDRVQAEMDAANRRLRFDPVEAVGGGGRRSFNWRDLGAIAAVLLLGASIFWPMLNGMRLDARRVAGERNLQQASLGFGLFASDHDDEVPSLGGEGVDGLWWSVGTPRKSHSANLYTLVRTGYVPLSTLASPGNPDAQLRASDPEAMDWSSFEGVSYSYQLFGDVVPRMASVRGGSRVLLADRSPIVERARQGYPVDPMANSSNAAGLGQLVLFSDGRVEFLRSPVLENGDNIWLPRRLEAWSRPRIVGTELPDASDDAFVGP